MPEKINVNELPDTSLPIPSGEYTLGVTALKQEPSGKGSCMDTFDLEVLDPADVMVGEDKIGCAGRKAMMRIVYSAKTLKRLQEHLPKIGVNLTREEWGELEVPTIEEVKSGAYKTVPAIQDLTKLLVRQSFLAKVKSTPYFKTDTGTYDGKPLIDPATGQKIIAGYKNEVDLSDVLSVPGPF
jgi:hypothetical protein